MRNLLRNTFNIGLLAAGLLWANSGTAQKTKRDWLQPDIKYIDQRGFSLGVNLGMSDMWGDVGAKSALDHYGNSDYWKNMKVMGGIYGRYTHIPGLSFRLSIANGTLYANDVWNKSGAEKASSISDDYVQRYYRNLDVKTNIWESSLMVEISPMELFTNWENSRLAKSRFQPYLMVGVGGIYFNPRGSITVDYTTQYKKWVDLRPLHTEGQNFDKPGYPAAYNQYAIVIPAGIGFRVDLGKGLGLGLEYVMRYALTDYLDDVSGKYVDPLRFDIGFLNEGYKAGQAKVMADKTFEIAPGIKHAAGEYRGDPNTKDMYSTISLNFFWKINKRANAWWR
ncbi:hypothetical protein DBR32_07510 [Taibaiella sp. KBW10]|uniref:hypothetical protein n=1 Tax=Taibaiella sp. KBW10 TaxID=2153357 RepID=UPI000F5A2370|nr:hypothetical protein [Taibaiella sp. KBW10]RQO31780.1 hypothetical protein DBR32_07510 [Taibaiella sp. KBW10]